MKDLSRVLHFYSSHSSLNLLYSGICYHHTFEIAPVRVFTGHHHCQIKWCIPFSFYLTHQQHFTQFSLFTWLQGYILLLPHCSLLLLLYWFLLIFLMTTEGPLGSVFGSVLFSIYSHSLDSLKSSRHTHFFLYHTNDS